MTTELIKYLEHLMNSSHLLNMEQIEHDARLKEGSLLKMLWNPSEANLTDVLKLITTLQKVTNDWYEAMKEQLKQDIYSEISKRPN